MALTKEDKDYLDLKFDPIIDHLGRINGSLKHHDEQIDNIIIDRTKINAERVHHLDNLNCVVEKVEKIDTNLLEYKVIKKYPKLFVVMSSIFVAWMVFEILQYFVLPM